MKRIPNNHPTRLLRHKLGITQSELADLTGTSRCMIARNESGEKEMNLDATVKVSYLTMCVNGVFEQQPHLHHDSPPTYKVEALTPERVRYLRQAAEIKVIKTERALQLFDETRANAELTLRRLAQLDITRLPGFTADDLDWMHYVMSKLHVTLHAHTDLARLELTLTLVRERAAIAAYDAVLLDLEIETHGAQLMDSVQAILSADPGATEAPKTEPQAAETAAIAPLDSVPISPSSLAPRRSARVIPLRNFSSRTARMQPLIRNQSTFQPPQTLQHETSQNTPSRRFAVQHSGSDCPAAASLVRIGNQPLCDAHPIDRFARARA